MNLIEELEKNQKLTSSRQIRGRFITQLSMLIEGFGDQYSISQILHTLTRKANDSETPYFWDDDKMLSKAEQLYKKLVKESQESDEE